MFILLAISTYLMYWIHYIIGIITEHPESLGLFAIVLIYIIMRYGIGSKNFSLSFLSSGAIVFAVFELYNAISQFSRLLFAYANDPFGPQEFYLHFLGPFTFLYWVGVVFLFLLPQLLWIKKIRQNIWLVSAISLIAWTTVSPGRLNAISLSLRLFGTHSTWLMEHFFEPADVFNRYLYLIGYILLVYILAVLIYERKRKLTRNAIIQN